MLVDQTKFVVMHFVELEIGIFNFTPDLDLSVFISVDMEIWLESRKYK